MNEPNRQEQLRGYRIYLLKRERRRLEGNVQLSESRLISDRAALVGVEDELERAGVNLDEPDPIPFDDEEDDYNTGDPDRTVNDFDDD